MPVTNEEGVFLLNQGGLTYLIDQFAAIYPERYRPYNNHETGQVVVEALNNVDQISFEHFVKLWDLLIRTRRIRLTSEVEAEERGAREAAEAEEANRPTPESAFERFYRVSTAQQIRQRIRQDLDFALFARAKMTAEMPIADDPLSQPPPTGEPHPALKRFADAYRSAPSASLRPVAGVVVVGDEKFSVTKFNQLVEQASAARLI